MVQDFTVLPDRARKFLQRRWEIPYASNQQAVWKVIAEGKGDH